MRYCLSGNQTEEYIKKADELKLELKYLDKVLDIYEINPEASIIAEIPLGTGEIEIDWNKIEQYNTMLRGNLIVGTADKKYMEVAKALGIKFYYTVPVMTFYELKALVEMGSYYAVIDGPLAFNLPTADKFDINLRLVPNVAYYDVLSFGNGVVGSWVRPEDVDIYEEYIDTFEFEDCDLKKERALFDTYKKGQWLGSLRNLITNFDYAGTSRMIHKEFAQMRVMCGQKCMTGFNCSSCYRHLRLADPQKMEKYTRKVKDIIKKNRANQSNNK